MLPKFIGVVLIMASSGAVGLILSAGYHTEEGCLTDLLSVLEYMECELNYRLTPLPELCRQAASDLSKPLNAVFNQLSNELEAQVAPNPQCCMTAALAGCRKLPHRCHKLMNRLGKNLGKFDAEGQIMGLNSLKSECLLELNSVRQQRAKNLRSYQTLSLCAGAALSILFL